MRYAITLRKDLADLCLKCGPLGELSRNKAPGELSLLCDALRCEQVGVAELVIRLREITYLDQALVDECVQDVVQAAGTHAELGRDFALREVWIT